MKTTSQYQEKQQSQMRYLESLRRWTLAILGILSVGLAALGAILPGLPTTIFLIAAIYLFTRSCPRLEAILIRNRFFRPFLPYLDGEIAMPVRAKLITIAIMWFFIAISCISLLMTQRMSLAFISLIPAAGMIGTYFVANHGSK
jgi:uncharacterized membrane protein YbaN (DUF454 family)